uniref:GB1/RHD3-type G domain-containing protein n=1 Tax=Strigamia maritima TaxID=126957 RepID=T1IGY0_STRMM
MSSWLEFSEVPVTENAADKATDANIANDEVAEQTLTSLNTSVSDKDKIKDSKKPTSWAMSVVQKLKQKVKSLSDSKASQKEEPTTSDGSDENSEKQNFAKLIAIFNETTGKIDMDAEVLKGILTDEQIRDKKVAIISVAGIFRKGKSFLLNFFILYFKHMRNADWLTIKQEEPLEGFSWRSGATGDTLGIWIWSKPLIVQDVAIFLMDSEGTEDPKQCEQANTNVLAWCTMISTVTIYNLQGQLQRDNLNNLHFCVEYARMTVESDDNPFQKLITLIRDWQPIVSYSWGSEGGMQYLRNWTEDTLKRSENNEKSKPAKNNEEEKITDENKSLNKMLQLFLVFKQFKCFLMPHSGENVFKNKDFRGQRNLIDCDFLKHINEFIPDIISNIEENTVLKTGPELYKFIEIFFKAINSAEQPRTETIYDLHVKVCNITAQEKANDRYKASLNEKISKASKAAFNNASKLNKAWRKTLKFLKIAKEEYPIDPSGFNKAQKEASDDAEKFFLDTKKYDGNRNNQNFIDDLLKNINNDGKNFFNLIQENKAKEKAGVVGAIVTTAGVGAASVAAGAVVVVTTVATAGLAAAVVGVVALLGFGIGLSAASKNEKLPDCLSGQFTDNTTKYEPSYSPSADNKKSKSADNNEKSKSADNTEKSKSADNNEKSKSADNNEKSKSADNNEKSKSADNNEKSKSVNVEETVNKLLLKIQILLFIILLMFIIILYLFLPSPLVISIIFGGLIALFFTRYI